MAELVIPDIDPATRGFPRERADRHAQTVETEARAILAEALQPPVSNDLGRCQRHAGRRLPGPARISDSTPLLREDRDR